MSSSIQVPQSGEATADLSAAESYATRTYRVTPEGRRTALVLLIGVAAIAVFAVWTIITLFDGGLSGPEWITAVLMLALALLAPLVGWNLLEERAAAIAVDERGLTFRSLGGIELSYPWSQVRGLRGAAERKSRWASFFFDDEEQRGDTTLHGTPASGASEATGDALKQSSNRDNSDKESNNSRKVVIPASSENEETVALATAESGGQRAGEPQREDEDEDEAIPTDDDDRETLEIVVGDPGLERIANPLVRALHRQSHGRFVPVYPGMENREQLLAEIARRSAGS